MNTKVFLITSSLLMVMNGVNIGDTMEDDFDGNDYKQIQERSELARTNDSLRQKSRDFISMINIMNSEQFNMKDFEIFLNTICDSLRKECKLFINSSEKPYKYYFNTLIDMCIKFDNITVTHRLGLAIKQFQERLDGFKDNSVKTILENYVNEILQKCNVYSIEALLQSILKDKLKMEESMEQEHLQQENIIPKMEEELNKRKIELERQAKDLECCRNALKPC